MLDKYKNRKEEYGALLAAVAAQYNVPAALHLDHGDTPDTASGAKTAWYWLGRYPRLMMTMQTMRIWNRNSASRRSRKMTRRYAGW